jgi:hypothetical protein
MAEVLPRPRTGHEAVADDDVDEVIGYVDDRTLDEQAPSQPPAPRRPTGRRLPHPPGKRAPLWFAALVAGALIAAVPSLFGGPQEVRITASDYGLGSATDGSLTGGMEEAGARQGLTEAEARARLGELAASRAAREPKTVLPVHGRLTTCFCMRWGQMHWGIDLAAPLGTQIVAATDGVVLRAGPASGFGNAIYIQDAEGLVHIYGHMKYYNVHAGDIVHAGDPIAKVGSQGYSTGPHLHYEIHKGGMTGKPIDPQQYLAEHNVLV